MVVMNLKCDNALTLGLGLVHSRYSVQWELLLEHFLFFYLLAVPHGMWDLSSPTRD